MVKEKQLTIEVVEELFDRKFDEKFGKAFDEKFSEHFISLKEFIKEEVNDSHRQILAVNEETRDEIKMLCESIRTVDQMNIRKWNEQEKHNERTGDRLVQVEAKVRLLKKR